MVKNLLANAEDIRDMSLIFEFGRSPNGRLGNPLQYYCPENPMDGEAWSATVHRVTITTYRRDTGERIAFYNINMWVGFLLLHPEIR